MNDCSNAEIRDQLPDLLHDRLEVSLRAEVQAHVDDCVDCRSELELLRSVQGVLLQRTPRVDVNSVVRALPKRAVQPVRAVPARRVWADWRIAAAVTLLAVGGTSVAVMNRETGTAARIDAATSASPSTVAQPAQPITDSAIKAASGVQTVAVGGAPATDQSGLATAAPLGDLSEGQLRALLNEIDRLEAVLVAEPDPVAIRVNATNVASPEGI